MRVASLTAEAALAPPALPTASIFPVCDTYARETAASTLADTTRPAKASRHQPSGDLSCAPCRAHHRGCARTLSTVPPANTSLCYLTREAACNIACQHTPVCDARAKNGAISALDLPLTKQEVRGRMCRASLRRSLQANAEASVYEVAACKLAPQHPLGRGEPVPGHPAGCCICSSLQRGQRRRQRAQQLADDRAAKMRGRGSTGAVRSGDDQVLLHLQRRTQTRPSSGLRPVGV